ncbi:MAG: hypothetical protein ACTSW7_01085 [Candidatus Thorarchaeota archaeon]|nr:MAG: hypothetical protein DRQ25_04900 [Candidatus Fermentibacteria bacterium]HEC72031.1 hypothetical protein [Thermoplasmatales archaeon]
MSDEEKKEGISTRIFSRKKKESPEEEKAKVMEEPEAMKLEETAPEPPPPAVSKAPAKKSKLAGHPVARRKHRTVLSQKPKEAHKYLQTK